MNLSCKPLIFCTLITLGGCGKRTGGSAGLEPAARPGPVAGSRVEAPAAAATPEPNHFAPKGVYYLVSAISVETKNGIAGLKPGTEVLKQSNGKYRAGEHEIALRNDQITNDLRVAGRLATADSAAQAAIRSAGQAAAAAAERGRLAMLQKAAQSALMLNAAPAALRPAAPVGNPVSPASTSLSPGGVGATHDRVTDRKRLHKGTDGSYRYD